MNQTIVLILFMILLAITSKAQEQLTTQQKRIVAISKGVLYYKKIPVDTITDQTGKKSILYRLEEPDIDTLTVFSFGLNKYDTFLLYKESFEIKWKMDTSNYIRMKDGKKY